MNNWLRLPGFPPPEKQDLIRFHLFKSLPYTTRMLLYLLLLAVGFVVQFFTLSAFPGAILLIIAVLLTLVRGYKSRLDKNALKAGSEWTTVNMEKIREVDEFNARLTKWDRDGLDISNGMGFLTFVLALVGILAASLIMRIMMVDDRVRAIFTIDAIVLVLPLWFNGLRQITRQDLLCIKTDIVRKMEAFFQTVCRDGEHFNPSLLLSRDRSGKSVPTDCRFTISFDGMPPDFYGIQAQINLNSVEGTHYPYFYCVLAAKNGFGLERFAQMIPVPKSILLQFQSDSNAEVIVIRQRTTKTSGYHTKLNSCKSILERALYAGRLVMDSYKQSQ